MILPIYWPKIGPGVLLSAIGLASLVEVTPIELQPWIFLTLVFKAPSLLSWEICLPFKNLILVITSFRIPYRPQCSTYLRYKSLTLVIIFCFIYLLLFFSGKLQENIFDYLPNLEVFNLYDNSFEGDIPATLSKCKNLQYLSWSFNYFSGIILKEIGNLTKLKEIYLGFNKLQGMMQPRFFPFAEW